LRGLSTISRSAEPLYIVDGVVVDNSSTQLVDLGGYTSNRIADLDPNDIEHVEVVKGAAAAALYGSRANNGVIQIFTRRGRAGALRTTFRASVGQEEVERRIAVNRAPVNAAGQPVTRFDWQDEIFRTAPSASAQVSVSGGDEKTQIFLSGGYQSQDGVIRSTDYRRGNVRVNVDRELSDWLRLQTSAAYSDSRASLQPNGGLVSNVGVLTGFFFNANDRDLRRNPSTGVWPAGQLASNPLEVIANWKAPQRVSRFTGGLTFSAAPIDELSVNYRFGYDTYGDQQSQFVPRGASASALVQGMAISANLRARLTNSDLDAAYKWPVLGRWAFTTSGGVNYQQQKYDGTTARAEDLAVLVSTVQGSRQFASQFVDERRILGIYGQQQASWGDLLTATAALRSDESSAFGADVRRQSFPKFGATVDLSSLGGFQDAVGRWLNRVRLRGGLGYSGEQPPGSFDRFSNYVFEPTGDRAGIVNSTQQGNQSLKPERARELEFGADIELLNGRFGIELTRFDKTVSDLILPRAVTPSSGFLQQLANVGELQNEGIELLLRSFNVRRTDLTWNTTFTYATNDPVVTKVSTGGAFFVPESFNIIRVDAGQAPGHFFGTTYVRDAAGNILNAQGQPIQDASGKIVGIPAIGTRKIIGNPNPKGYWSLSNEFIVRTNLNVRVQFDGVQGVDLFNFDRRLLETPAFGVGAEYAKELTGAVPRGFFAARRSIFEEYIEDGAFTKLREVALTWTVPRTFAQRLAAQGASLTVSGRNLKTWTDYSGWDPEANAGGQRTLVRGFGFATVPIPRSVQLSLNLNY
ncbi:MAG: SusC/RagA family TonB-linked outer membrane protein, partial [Gemmatimonadaceae bacterium]